MYDTVHVDEEWFFIEKVKSRYVLSEVEELPTLTCPNKSHILKVMLLAAVVLPLYDYATKSGIDGKIGIFPIVTTRIAKRTTSNQTRGDVITDPVSVDKKVYYRTLVDHVLPAIQAKWIGMCKWICSQVTSLTTECRETNGPHPTG
jgi:hypothetical protein